MVKVELGKVVKLHGYMGAMKVRTVYDADFNFKKIGSVFVDENEYKTKSIKKTKDGLIIELEGVSLEMATAMIGKMFLIDRSLVDGKILIEDLKGSAVKFEDGNEVGKITDVQDYGAAEVIYVKTKANEEIMFPNVNGVILNFDLNSKTLTLNKEKFGEVCDYEN
ncbi:MAG: 16S rRNA processing protein RimM [Clostridia bacterium]|nr:16S rRNA processing protein RimM [Clostridia bacterium]